VVTTPPIFFERGEDQVSYGLFYFSAEQPDGGKPTYSVCIETSRSQALGWTFWRDAYDGNATRFVLRRGTARFTDEGQLLETASATVSRPYLELAKQSGLTWKFYGDEEQGMFSAPPNVVQGFLAKCDQGLTGP
jgi:hypothetical protein